MAHPTPDLPPGQLESRQGHDPHVRFFYFLVAGLLLLLGAGLAYQQLFNSSLRQDQEVFQSQRRILVPGPRGNIFDREGRLLAGNRPRFAVSLSLDDLHAEFHREYILIRNAYRANDDKNLPSADDMAQIARATVVQRYLDFVNQALGRQATLDRKALDLHFRQRLLLPYMLIEDLQADEYARLIEQLPVTSPLQVYAASVRDYPFHSLAAHTIGYVSANEGASPDADFPGQHLTTLKMKGSYGRDGLEKQFDARLQGETGGAIYRVSPAGYRLQPPLEKRTPVPGHDLTTSLDVDLQLTAENELEDRMGAVIALDIHTGEVLVLASKPGYNLQDFVPHLSQAEAADIYDRGAYLNRAVSGLYPPGSTFKILTSIAALRSGALTPDDLIADCQGKVVIGGHTFTCDNGEGHHGELSLRAAIAQSCDIYFYEAGLRTNKINPEVLAAEGRRFHLDRPTGIELPGETSHMIIPDPAWKKREQNNEGWFVGDTANMAIGQGFVRLTPLGMACFVASVARGEVYTQPTLLHDPNAPTQHHESIGLTIDQRTAIVGGMEDCTLTGTAKILATPAFQIPGLRIAGKTGTAQIPGKKDVAWFICFAPLEDPQIAVAVAIEGDVPGESYGGGMNASPVAAKVLRVWKAKQSHDWHSVTFPGP